MNITDFYKFLQPVQRKIFLLIGRGKLTSVDNGDKTMKVQITGLKDETISDIEVMSQFGFEARPKTSSPAEPETVTLFINGNRDHGLVISIHDRHYRPDDLSEGDVCVYNVNSDQRVWLKADKSIMIKDGNGGYFELKDDKTFRIEDATGAYIKSDTSKKIDINGNLTVEQ